MQVLEASPAIVQFVARQQKESVLQANEQFLVKIKLKSLTKLNDEITAELELSGNLLKDPLRTLIVYYATVCTGGSVEGIAELKKKCLDDGFYFADPNSLLPTKYPDGFESLQNIPVFDRVHEALKKILVEGRPLEKDIQFGRDKNGKEMNFTGFPGAAEALSSKLGLSVEPVADGQGSPAVSPTTIDYPPPPTRKAPTPLLFSQSPKRRKLDQSTVIQPNIERKGPKP